MSIPPPLTAVPTGQQRTLAETGQRLQSCTDGACATVQFGVGDRLADLLFAILEEGVGDALRLRLRVAAQDLVEGVRRRGHARGHAGDPGLRPAPAAATDASL